MTGLRQTPSQTVGPFFTLGLMREPLNVLVDAGVAGDRIRIEGRVLDGAGDPVDDALIEVWQADADGQYPCVQDPGATSPAPAFRGFGRADTTARGAFFFETVKPGPVRGSDGRRQAPHLNVVVFARGLLLHAFTRMYFSDDVTAAAGDALLTSLDADRRRTLIADRTDRDGSVVYSWDIHLQGERETVFLDA